MQMHNYFDYWIIRWDLGFFLVLEAFRSTFLKQVFVILLWTLKIQQMPDFTGHFCLCQYNGVFLAKKNKTCSWGSEMQAFS